MNKILRSKLDCTLLFVSFYSKLNYYMILKNRQDEFVWGVKIMALHMFKIHSLFFFSYKKGLKVEFSPFHLQSPLIGKNPFKIINYLS